MLELERLEISLTFLNKKYDIKKTSRIKHGDDVYVDKFFCDFKIKF